MIRDDKRKLVRRKAELAAEERLLDALVGAGASPRHATAFRKKLRAGELDDKDIEIEIAQSGGADADVRTAQHAGLADRRHLDRRYFRQGDGQGASRAAPR